MSFIAFVNYEVSVLRISKKKQHCLNNFRTLLMARLTLNDLVCT